ncbi:TPA: restriction endonuclease subunit S [Campylobacter coli]|nr:restriction endonuclease subunit S [Campylobacter coli]
MSKIEVVWFKDLDLWSVALQNQSQIKSNFPLCYLSEVLEDLTESRKITINDSLYYKEPTISSKNNTISVRKKGYGKEFKVKRRVKILPGDLVIAKMHTQNGLYAISQDEFASTSTFIPFRILDNINKDYLFAILKKTLSRLVKFDSVNRETYTTSEILKLKIPLPPLEIQREIVEKIKNIQDKIKALQDEEKRLKEEIEVYLYITLGLERKQEKKKQKVFVMEFKNLDRWDVKHNQDDVGNSNKVSFESIENIVRYMQRGKTPKYSNIKQYPVIAQKCIQWNGIDMKKSLFIDPDSIKNYTQDRFLQDDDILLNSTGIGTLGRVALYKSTINPYAAAVADGHVTVLRFDKDKILPNYFYCYFSSSMIQDSIEEYATGSTKQKELSLSLVKQIQIPLPPLEIQKQIVEHIESKQKIIEDNKYKIENLQSDINKELQELILA